jgi:O-antigen ligase
MIKTAARSWEVPQERKIAFLLSPIIVPSFVIMIAVLLGGVLGTLDTSTAAFIIGALLFLIVLVLRQYELAVAMILVAHIYIDWFVGREIVGTTAAVGLLFLLFIVRSHEYPWVTPRAMWLWVLFLIITIPPTIQGSKGSPYNFAFYYPNTIFGALVMFWLGLLVTRNEIHLRTLFQILAILGTLLALHTIIQTTTGIVLFGTPRFDAYLAQVANFGLASSNVFRAGSFFENPDWNGTFFAVMLFLPLGLFAEASSILQKCLYFIEMLFVSIALLFTYSGGAWIGVIAGIVTFILFAGRGYYRILVPLLMVIIGAILMIVFPTELNALFRHLSDPVEESLRTGAWQTAINVIRAFPLTGIGLGLTSYIQGAEPFRAPAQYLPLAHPHDSYLEWGAMTGLPVLFVFLALLLFSFWQAWRNWIRVDTGTRCLIGGGIAAAVALSINSISINGWTLPPLAAIGWLILGAIASPLVRKTQPNKTMDDFQA